MDNRVITIIGAGLAGCEAALQLADHGKKVVIYDQKPEQLCGPYCMKSFAELVCNNALGPRSTNDPRGLLISELDILGSKLLRIAKRTSLSDNTYLSVNKKDFSESVSAALLHSNNITFISECCKKLPKSDILIVASGPTTNGLLLDDISAKYNLEDYHFADSSCAVVDIESIDLSNPHIRKVSEDLYVVSIPDIQFINFSQALSSYYLSTKESHDDHSLLESHSIEELALNSPSTLKNSRFSHEGFDGACLLLRREGVLENGFIMVGCMTTLRHVEQRNAFSMLPGFSNVRIIKYGRMHQNTFFNSPGHIDSFYKVHGSDLYIIGQLSGIDGYGPAISSGFVAANKILYGDNLPIFPKESMIGSLAGYVSNENIWDFQPMCASFALIPGDEDVNKVQKAQNAVQNYASLLRNLSEKQ